MGKVNRILVIFISAALLIQVACSQSPQQPAEKTVPSPAVPTKPPDFQVTDLKLTPTVANVGEPFKVSARINNKGGSGDYKAILTLDGVENSNKNISVAESGSQDAVFTLTLSTRGRYQVGIGPLKAPLIVSDCSQKNPYTIKYDSGPATTAGELAYYGTNNTGQITRFTPPFIPFTVQKVLLYTRVTVENDAELDQRIATINLWDSNNKKVWSKDYAWRLFQGYGTWKEFAVPDVIFTGDFSVEFVSHSEMVKQRQNSNYPIYTCISLLFNIVDNPYSAKDIPKTRSDWSVNGLRREATGEFGGKNWLIRVEGSGCLLENKVE